MAAAESKLISIHDEFVCCCRDVVEPQGGATFSTKASCICSQHTALRVKLERKDVSATIEKQS